MHHLYQGIKTLPNSEVSWKDSCKCHGLARRKHSQHAGRILSCLPNPRTSARRILSSPLRTSHIRFNRSETNRCLQKGLLKPIELKREGGNHTQEIYLSIQFDRMVEKPIRRWSVPFSTHKSLVRHPPENKTKHPFALPDKVDPEPDNMERLEDWEKAELPTEWGGCDSKGK